MKQPKFQFGERVLVDGNLARIKVGDKRTWVRSNYPQPREAIFLGYRTLADGEVKYYSYPYNEDGDIYLKVTTYHPSACICIKGFKPENVFLSMITKLP
jgi:hypothetical protein